MAVLDLFRPTLQQNPTQSLGVEFFSAENRTVEDVCLASVNQLKHLMLVFRTRYSCARSCFLWHNALLYVANDCVSKQMSLSGNKAITEDVEMTGTNTDASKRVHWFLACIEGYKALAPQLTIVSGIIQGLLSMGIERGLITAAEGRAYMDEVEADGATWAVSRASIQGHPRQPWATAGSFTVFSGGLPESKDHFIVDLNKAMTDLNAASIEALSQRFKEVVMLDELSTSKHTTSPPL
ncbi:hypothetical protein N0V82_007295 [Gnomoniopsis sp. IMI 355080]|nr:hypothetical protein N0V82_007295 [Gnomoniopsis sp. IMI 355080]